MSKVRRVRQAVDDAGLQVDVEVDGGIDRHTVMEAAGSGANVFVAGSAVFGRPDPLAAVSEIQNAATDTVAGARS
jgi:ribulose-phosphate 3-epimerase